MNRLASILRRFGGWYISAQILLATHLLAFVLGMAAMFVTVLTVLTRTIPGFAQVLERAL